MRFVRGLSAALFLAASVGTAAADPLTIRHVDFGLSRHHATIGIVIEIEHGARNLWPENSLDGFHRTRALGIEGVEFDVHVASDGELVANRFFPTDLRFRDEAAAIAHARDWAVRWIDASSVTI